MASNNARPNARYESLASIQPPSNPGTPTRPAPFMRQASIAGGVSSYPERRNIPQRPGKVGHLVRMASEVLLIPARSASYYDASADRDAKDQRRISKNYGTVTETGRLRDESAVADENDNDDDDDYEEEPIWGHGKLLLLTAGLAGAQLSWSVELG